MLVFVCDECGAKDSKQISLGTGYVFIDGMSHGQSCDLCEEHYPKPNENQPNNCKRVVFHWPEATR